MAEANSSASRRWIIHYFDEDHPLRSLNAIVSGPRVGPNDRVVPVVSIEDAMSDEAIRRLDSIIAPIIDEDEMPSIDDYRRALAVALGTTRKPEEA